MNKIDSFFSREGNKKSIKQETATQSRSKTSMKIIKELIVAKKENTFLSLQMIGIS